MPVILVRYAEIALKGGNRRAFERKLQENIQRALQLPPTSVQLHQTQIAVHVSPGEEQASLAKLAEVFGIAWYALTVRCESSLQEIIETAVEVAKEAIAPGQTFAIRGQRSDKRLPFDTLDIERELGEAVIKATGAKVDLDAPAVTVHVVAAEEGSYVFTEKLRGPGGLPVGTSGKVLSLISGGFDSIASSYLMAKRGAQVDLLHFHVFPDKEQVVDSKITEIVSNLSSATLSKRLYLASYLPFEARVWELDRREARYELVVFRRLMVRVAEALARRGGYQAIVLGDSLGQVASQTMENIVAVDEAVEIPIFRPLIGMDKVELIRLVRRMGLFDLAAAPYKDCCSILTPNPVTRAYLPKVHALEEELGLPALVEELAEAVEKVPVLKLRRAAHPASPPGKD